MLYVRFLLCSAFCIISAEMKVSEVQGDEHKLSLCWASLSTMTVELDVFLTVHHELTIY